MPISVLFIESDAGHAQAMCDHILGEGLTWELSVAASLADARHELDHRGFDALVVSRHLSDGRADALGPVVVNIPALLLIPDGEWVDSALLLRQGFADFLGREAALNQMGALSARVLLAIERHHTTRDLRQRAETLEVAVAGAEVGIWDWHVGDDRNTVNERWCQMLGYASEEVVLVGGVWLDWVHPQDLPRLKSALYPGAQAAMYQFEVEFRVRHRQGHWIWVLSRGHVVEQDARGLPARLAGTHTDVTRQKEEEFLRDRQHRQLRAISVAQSLFLRGSDTRAVFEGLLAELLALTQGDYGFVGEVLYSGEGKPYLKAHALTDISWDTASRQTYEAGLADAMEFHNPDTLFGAALRTGKPVISNAPEADARKGGLPSGHPALMAFLGIPIHYGHELVAMIGLANKPGGYSQEDVDFLEPLSRTIGYLVSAWRSDKERREVQAELSQTSELLAQKTAMLESTVESLKQGVFKFEPDGTLSVYNHKALELLELPVSLVERPVSLTELVQFQIDRGDMGPDITPEDIRTRGFVKLGGGVQAVERYLRTTRVNRTIEVQSRILPDGGMVRTFTDVTEYLQVQAALQQSEERFRGLTQLSSDWFWEQDEEHRFVRLDGEFIALTGWNQSEAYVGVARWEMPTENMTAADWQAHRAELGARQTFRDLELCRRDLSGQLYWISVSGAPFFDSSGAFKGYRGVGRNITQRKRVDAQLRETSDLLKLTLDNISQGIAMVDPSGRVSVYNRRLLELLDLPESLLALKPLLAEVFQFQMARGDLSNTPEFMGTIGDGVDSLMKNALLETYVRRARSGCMVEVRSNPTAGGGIVRTFTDVSSYFDAQTAAQQSESRFRALVELSSDWYWEQDADFRFKGFVGDPLVAVVTPEEGDGKTRWEIGALNLTEKDWTAHRADLEAHRTFRDFEMKRPLPDGSVYWVSVSGVPIFDASGVFTGYRGVGRNITARKQAESQIERLAFFDVLTDLPNRRLLIERLRLAMISSTRSQQYGALLFIDLDNFKTLNDTHGHDIGDMLLREVALRLSSSVREVDTVARLGGDEFVVMLQELSTDEARAAAQVKSVGEKILSALNELYSLPGQEHHSTPSIGITLFLGNRDSSDELLKRADVAMYQAKAAGRNTLRFFDPAMQAAVAARAGLEMDLRQCVQRNELVLHFQPVVDVDRYVVGVEALVRWQHPQRGLIPPGEFIGLAEHSGLILAVGNWVLQSACRQLVAWSARRETRTLTMSVNVSERQIRQGDFVGQVCDVLSQTGADPGLLKLEITESLLLTDTEDIIVKMGALKTIGVRFSLDDFGTGYSSLAYLKRLPIDQLKIDKSFVLDVLTDPNDAAIAQTILALAGSLGLETVAEGVETEGQLKFLLQNGCRWFQGYYFGKPMPIDALDALLDAGDMTLAGSETQE